MAWAIFLLVALLFLAAPGYLIYSDFFTGHHVEPASMALGLAKVSTRPTTNATTQSSWRTVLKPFRRFPATNAAAQPPILRLLAMGDDDAALDLIDKGANVNVISTDGRQTSPLVEACVRPEDESLDVVHTLVEKGADVNHKMVNGITPLMRAVRSRSPQTVAYLISSGAKVNELARGNESALDLANQAGLTDIAATLTAAGAKSGSVLAPRKPATRPKPTTVKAPKKPASGPSKSATRPTTQPA